MRLRDRYDAWREGVRLRASRRKSAWNLLLLLHWPVLLALWYVMAYALHARFGAPCAAHFLRCLPDGFWTGFFVTSLLFPAIPLSMLVTNFLLFCIPPARRAFAGEASGHPGTGFRETQKKLLCASLALLALCGGAAVFALGKIYP